MVFDQLKLDDLWVANSIQFVIIAGDLKDLKWSYGFGERREIVDEKILLGL